MINELAGEPALEKFKAEFEKVHNALIEANLSNTKLAAKEGFNILLSNVSKVFTYFLTINF